MRARLSLPTDLIAAARWNDASARQGGAVSHVMFKAPRGVRVPWTRARTAQAGRGHRPRARAPTASRVLEARGLAGPLRRLATAVPTHRALPRVRDHEMVGRGRGAIARHLRPGVGAERDPEANVSRPRGLRFALVAGADERHCGSIVLPPAKRLFQDQQRELVLRGRGSALQVSESGEPNDMNAAAPYIDLDRVGRQLVVAAPSLDRAQDIQWTKVGHEKVVPNAQERIA